MFTYLCVFSQRTIHVQSRFPGKCVNATKDKVDQYSISYGPQLLASLTWCHAGFIKSMYVGLCMFYFYSVTLGGNSVLFV